MDACPSGVEVFADASFLYYYFVSRPPLSDECARFLARVDIAELLCHTSASVVADVIHKVMMAQAADLHGSQRAGLLGRLRRHPELVAGLDAHLVVLPELQRLGVVIHPLQVRDLRDAAGISCQHGLLTGDALVLAVMQRLRLTHLATNDDDFERIPALACYFPR